jgi:hypothetical protein
VKQGVEETSHWTASYIIRTIKTSGKRWVRHVAHMEAIRKAYKTPVGKPDWKREHGKI